MSFLNLQKDSFPDGLKPTSHKIYLQRKIWIVGGSASMPRVILCRTLNCPLNLLRNYLCKGKRKRQKKARNYFSFLDDGLKSMAEDFNSFPQELRLLIKMELRQKERDKQILAMQDDIKRLEAKVTVHNDDYFTVAGCASLRGLNVDTNKANMLGRKASKLSIEYGYDIEKAKDARYGVVNTYHVDILKEVSKR